MRDHIFMKGVRYGVSTLKNSKKSLEVLRAS